MDTLCSDLLDSIYNHTNPYQCILLDREVEDYDMKWFLYNYEHNSGFGLEVLNLIQKQGLKFLELLYSISLVYESNFGGSYLCEAVIKLAFEHRLDYEKIKSIGIMFRCSSYHIQFESIKYTGYQYRMNNEPMQHLDDCFNIIIYAYQNGDEEIIDKVLAKTKDFKYECGTNILKYIVQKDYTNFVIEYDKIKKKFPNYTIIAKFFCYAAPLIRFGSIEMINYALKDNNIRKEIDQKICNKRLNIEPEFIEYFTDIYGANLANVAFQLGWDGPCWQRLENKDLCTISRSHTNSRWCTINIFDGFSPSRELSNSYILMKVDVFRRIFEADKPSKRELFKLMKLAKKFKRYDIYLYAFELFNT